MVSIVTKFLKSKNFWVSLARDILFAATLVGAIALALYVYAGVWPPLVSVDGTSMFPHMQGGDLILIQAIDPSKIVTYDAGMNSGYATFGEYGDVIVYRPFGRTDVTPVIHRAMYRTSTDMPMWEGSVASPNDGFITQGDNNFLYDQSCGISPNTPVKSDWVMGVARARIPYLGYVRSLFGFLG